jgi:hypothetical protein
MNKEHANVTAAPSPSPGRKELPFGGWRGGNGLDGRGLFRLLRPCGTGHKGHICHNPLQAPERDVTGVTNVTLSARGSAVRRGFFLSSVAPAAIHEFAHHKRTDA